MESSETIADQLAASHQRVLDALVDGDREGLGKLVADDCRIVGPRGFLLDKEEWIDAHGLTLFEQVMLEVEHTELTVRDDFAVRCDLQRSECLFDGETITGLHRVLNVWARTDEEWQLVGIQYTAVAPEAA